MTSGSSETLTILMGICPSIFWQSYMLSYPKVRIRKMRWNSGTKYHNQKIELNGEKFDSKGEMMRWEELKILERAGQIKNLRRQIVFELLPNQYAVVDGRRRVVERRVTYVADFVYEEGGETVVEDYKGFETEAFKLKKKMMLFFFGIQIRMSRR